MLNRVTAWAAVGALAAAEAVYAAPATLAEALDLWSSALTRFVDEQGRTDFDALAADRKDLDELVAYVERVSPATSPELFPRRADVLAYHLNAYNALAMRGVIDEGVNEGFTSFFKRQMFFKLRKVVIGGRSMSLSAYENEVIRPLGEPRVHFALNCMAVSPGRARSAARSRGARILERPAQRSRRRRGAPSLAVGYSRFLHRGFRRRWQARELDRVRESLSGRGHRLELRGEVHSLRLDAESATVEDALESAVAAAAGRVRSSARTFSWFDSIRAAFPAGYLPW